MASQLPQAPIRAVKRQIFGKKQVFLYAIPPPNAISSSLTTQTKLRPHPPAHPRLPSQLRHLPHSPLPKQARSARLPLPRIRDPSPRRTVLHPDAKDPTRQTQCLAAETQALVQAEEHQEDDGGNGAAVCVAGCAGEVR